MSTDHAQCARLSERCSTIILTRVARPNNGVPAYVDPDKLQIHHPTDPLTKTTFLTRDFRPHSRI